MEQRALRMPSPLLLRRESAVAARGHEQRTREAMERRGCRLSATVTPSVTSGFCTFFLLDPEATPRPALLPPALSTAVLHAAER